MSYTETTTRSWFARMKSALAGLIIGPILVIAAIILLFWNEGRAIETYRALAEGAGLVIDVAADAPQPGNEGKLVHVAGTVVPGGVAEDPDFAIQAEGAVGLSREVEMYQWVEKEDSKTETKLGGSEETVTTYTYSREWRNGRVKSEDFKQQDGHDNPELPIESRSFNVPDATIGGFTVSGDAVANLGDSKKIQLTDEDAVRFADYLGSDMAVERRNGDLYAGSDPSRPQVGDMRISYARADLKEASFVAAQQGAVLLPYTTTNGHEVFLRAAGLVPAEQMFKQAQDENVVITWLLRVVGLVCMLIGFGLFLSILGVIADFVPFFGSIVGFGTGLIALVLTLVLGPVVIAIGWFAYRPLLALSIIAGGALIAGGIWYLRRGKAVPTAQAAAGNAR